MYAYVNFVRNEQPRPEYGEEALKLHKELLPKRQQHAGYQGTLLLVDLVKGQAFDIDLYESQTHIQAAHQQGHYQGEQAQYEHLISEPPAQEVYEVAMHEIEMGSTLTHATVHIVQLPPDKLDEGITIFRDSVVPELRQFKGFKGALLLVNRQTGKSMGITVFDTEDEVKAVEHSGEYRRQIAKGAHLFSAPPSREVYEVAYYGLTK
jgi:heme-degrading monooxygenase HmoA/quinol monooxygenase YgiN